MPREQLRLQGSGYPGLPQGMEASGGKGEENELVNRPELEVFGLAMLGGGLVFGAAHPYGMLVIVWSLGRFAVLTEIDYPWSELGEATVVDIGGGVGKSRSILTPPCRNIHLVDQFELGWPANREFVTCETGGFDIQLSKLYPNLSFVIQDRGPVLQQAEHNVWPKENPSALAEDRVKFMQHDFFQQNPVQGAAIYWLRNILYCPARRLLLKSTEI